MTNNVREEFFQDISLLANGMPKDVVRNVYYSILNQIMNKLRKGEEMTLPDFGTVWAFKAKPRRTNDVQTQVCKIDPGTNRVKFVPCVKLKKYVRTLDLLD